MCEANVYIPLSLGLIFGCEKRRYGHSSRTKIVLDAWFSAKRLLNPMRRFQAYSDYVNWQSAASYPYVPNDQTTLIK